MKKQTIEQERRSEEIQRVGKAFFWMLVGLLGFGVGVPLLLNYLAMQ